jgi:hypothetical protein
MTSPTTDESGSLKICLQCLSVLPLNYYINIRTFFSKQLKTLLQRAEMCWRLSQLSSASALACCWRCSCIILPCLKKFHGLLSMSSRTVCPCFWISASFFQLASSIGCPFHLTKYSKYSFRLVLLLTLLSSMLSICGFSATGICLAH